MRIKSYKVYDRVQSIYKARWHGVICGEKSIIANSKTWRVYVVLPCITADGRPQRKPKARILSCGWLIPSTKTFKVPANRFPIDHHQP